MTKLEEVVQALYLRITTHFPDIESVWSESAGADIARAALEAIREPGEAVENIGLDAMYSECIAPGDHPDLKLAYTAMIDAILNEKPE